MKEAAVQRRHNLYRDSIVLSNSDPSLHLLGENPSIDWAGEYGGEPKEEETANTDAPDGEGEDGDTPRRRRMKQVVSMIQVEGSPIIPESCLEAPGVEDIPEEEEGETESAKVNEKENSPAEQTEAKEEENLNKEVVPATEDTSDDKGKSNEDTKTESDVASLTEAKEDGPVEKNAAEIVESDPEPAKEVPVSTETVEEAESTEKAPSGDAKDAPVTAEDAPLKTENTLVTNVDCSTSKNETEDEQAASSNLEESSDELLPPPLPEENAPESSTQDNPKEGPADFPLPLHDDSGFQSPTSDATEDEEVGNSQLKAVEEVGDKEAPQSLESESKEQQ